jgi:TetR/AcrR family transcriptional regulator, transcriptional repressor for nem operon
MTNDTKERICWAAMTLFAEKGYGSTSVSDILRAAGVNSGSLYYFFPGKQDVLLAVLEAYRAGIGPMLLEPAWVGVDDPIERVFALLASYRRRLEQTDCVYGCPIGSLALEIHEPDPAVRRLLEENFEGWTAAVEACYQAAGPRLPDDLDRRSLALFTLTTMEGGVMLARTSRDLAPFDAAVAMLRRYLDALVREPSSGH